MNDTRLQLHWAAQPAAGVSRALLAPAADDSHTAFAWRDGALRQGSGAALRFADLTLLYDGQEFPLAGRTLDDAYRFLEERIGEPVPRPSYELPDHAVAHGAPFAPDANDLARFASLYAEADRELQRIHTPVLCWPHHFDIATLIERGEGRTIGAGFVPGDAQYPEPYWYVTPWPYPDASTLPPLPLGFWHRDGWVGAVLPAGAGSVAEFLDAAIKALS
jgi:hypothetical protein